MGKKNNLITLVDEKQICIWLNKNVTKSLHQNFFHSSGLDATEPFN